MLSLPRFPEIALSGIMSDGPPRMKLAPFHAVRPLYFFWEDLICEGWLQVNAKTINPAPIEWQNVRLVQDVINGFVSNILRTHDSAIDITHFESLCLLIDIVLT